MSLPATGVWELRATGSDTQCGGGFNAARGGTDRSVADSAYKNGTNLTVDASTNTDVAPDGYTPDASADPGNFIQITAGGGFSTGFYEITSVVAGKWRLDHSPAAVGTSGGTWWLGGGLATMAAVNAPAVRGNLVYIKAGTYTISSMVTNNEAVTWIGYDTTRTPFNTDATLPLFLCGANGLIMLYMHAGIAQEIRNVSFDANGHTGATAVQLGHLFADARRCIATNFANGFYTNWNQNKLADCYAVGCGNGFYLTATVQGNLSGCVAVGGTIGYYVATNCVTMVDCIASGTSSYGFTLNGEMGVVKNCSSYNCGTAQFRLNSLGTEARNCVAYGGSGWQFDGVTLGKGRLINCASDAGGSGSYTNFNAYDVKDFITLTANPYTNAAGGDFSLNGAAGGGTAIKGLGQPASFTGISTSNAINIGAVQTGGASGLGPTRARVFTGM